MTKTEKLERLRNVICAIDPQVFDDLLLVASQTAKQDLRKEKLDKLKKVFYEDKVSEE